MLKKHGRDTCVKTTGVGHRRKWTIGAGFVLLLAGYAGWAQTPMVKEYIRLGGRVIAIETGAALGNESSSETGSGGEADRSQPLEVPVEVRITGTPGTSTPVTVRCQSNADFTCPETQPETGNVTAGSLGIDFKAKYQVSPTATTGLRDLLVVIQRDGGVETRTVKVNVRTGTLVNPRNQVLTAGMGNIDQVTRTQFTTRNAQSATWTLSSSPNPEYAGNFQGYATGQTATGVSVTYNAPQVQRKQTVTMTVSQTVTGGGTVTDTVTITVLPTVVDLYDPLPGAPMESGRQRQLRVAVSPVLKGLNRSINWTLQTVPDNGGAASTNPADTGTVDANGLYQAPVLTAGTRQVRITASTPGNWAVGTATILVSSKPLTLIPPSTSQTPISVLGGETKLLQVADALNNLPDTSWGLTVPTFPTGLLPGEFTQTTGAPLTGIGRDNPVLYTAPQSLPAGTSEYDVALRASLRANPAVQDTGVLRVKRNPNVQVTLKPYLPPSADPIPTGVDLPHRFGSSNPNQAVSETEFILTPIFHPDNDISDVDRNNGCSMRWVHGTTLNRLYLDGEIGSNGASQTLSGSWSGGFFLGDEIRLQNGRCSILLATQSSPGLWTARTTHEFDGTGGRQMSVAIRLAPVMGTTLYVYQKTTTNAQAGGTGWFYHRKVVAQAPSLPGFQLAVVQSPATIPAGQTGSYQIQIVPKNGFTGTVQLACVTPPIGVGCNTASGSAGQTVGLNVTANLPPGASEAVVVRGTYTGPIGTIVAETQIGVAAPGTPPGAGTGKSVRFTGTQRGELDLTGVPGLDAIQEWRIDFRVHNVSMSGGYLHFANLEGGGGPESYIYDTNLIAYFKEFWWYEGAVNGMTDIIVRMQRRPLAGGGYKNEAAAWNVSTGTPVPIYLYPPVNTYSGQPDNFARKWRFGWHPATAANLVGNYAYARLYPTAASLTVAPGNAPDPGAIFALEFEDSLVDTAQPGRSMVMVGTGGTSYVNTPAGGGPPPPPSFTIGLTPVLAQVNQGVTGQNVTVNVTPVNGFGNTTPVTLSCLNPPSGITCGSGTATVAAPGSLALSLPAALAGGNHAVTVRGTNGTVTADAVVVVAVTPPNFSLTSTPAAPTVASGTTSVVPLINVVPVGGFGSTTAVTLSCVNPPSGITCNAATATGAQPANLGINLPGGLGFGTYNVTVQGVGGGKTNTVVVPVQVAPPGSFTLSLSPGAATVVPGTATVTTQVAVNGTGGWPSTAPVALTCPGAPAGITCNAATATGAQAATLVVNVPVAITPGAYVVQVNGQLAGVSHTVNYALTVNVPPNSGRSLVLTGGTAQATWYGNPTVVTSYDIKARVHDMPSSYGMLSINTGPVNMYLTRYASGNVNFEITVPWSGGGSCGASAVLPSDFVVRLQDWTFTVYDKTETQVLHTGMWGCWLGYPPGTISFANMSVSGSGKVAWIRGTAGNWELENSLNSSSGGAAMVMQGTAQAAYDWTPPLN